MDIRLVREAHDELIVHLRDGQDETSVTVPRSRPGAQSLTRAFDAALSDGHGECFWPCTTGGQYWWMFKITGASIEVIVMWTRGGASLWEHVFRATDATSWVQQRLSAELARLGMV
jgi:hypothetical protein